MATFLKNLEDGSGSDALPRISFLTDNCPYTIWPAMYTDLSVSAAAPDYPTGWEAQPFTSVSFSAPNNWSSARIWGRRDCNFSITTGQDCLTGWCVGGLQCSTTSGTGVPPATLAEWTLSASGDEDYYDVSLVDGFNLPMEITTHVGCPTASCPVDLAATCPAPLQTDKNASGSALGCQSACDANLDNNPSNSPNCCTGSHSTAATCPSSGVAYYSFFKGNCPDAYAYAYDEASGTALWTCSAALQADYTLTFCPASSANGSSISSSVAGSTSAGASTSSASSSGASTAPTSPAPTAGALQAPMCQLRSRSSSSAQRSAGSPWIVLRVLLAMACVCVASAWL